MNDFKTDATTVSGWQQPRIFDLNITEQAAALKTLSEDKKIHYISDQIEAAIEELYHIENPAQIDDIDPQAYQSYVQGFGNGNTDNYGNWVYFPWNATLVHFPPADDLRKLRGSRNRNLITEEERQTLITDKTILILGLSVGSNVVDSLLMQGIGSKYILVDMDHLGPTNLNRIRASYDQLGIHKVDVLAKKISELDPYTEQVHYKDGVNDDNLEEMLSSNKPNIIIDEMDSLRMKVIIRLRAKELGIPVVMATDDGDDILLDIERYDQDSAQPILHGILPDEVVDSILNHTKMSRPEAGAIIGKYFVNLENVPVRMLESLLEVGKSLPSWPQLGGAAVLSGLYVSYAVKRILLGQALRSGRFVMGPEAQLNPDLETEAYKTRKTELITIITSGKPPANQ
ncbi:MAG: ThiF family adenylyltransferase [Candidatus Saccharimonadales bacterium]